MAVGHRQAFNNYQAGHPRISHSSAKVHAVDGDEYVPLSDSAVVLIGAVFWAFVGLLAGAWLSL
jgi:hypothetical protein